MILALAGPPQDAAHLLEAWLRELPHPPPTAWADHFARCPLHHAACRQRAEEMVQAVDATTAAAHAVTTARAQRALAWLRTSSGPADMLQRAPLARIAAGSSPVSGALRCAARQALLAGQ